jgi:hypothetical protein
MDLPFKKVGAWIVETAQMKHLTRKYSMSEVAQTHLRRLAAEYGVMDYQKFLTDLSDNPELYDQMREEEREFNDISSSIGVWVTIAACVKPYIPITEWLTLDDTTVNDLSTAVQEINPHWFTATPLQEKKTKRTRKKSMKKSMP